MNDGRLLLNKEAVMKYMDVQDRLLSALLELGLPIFYVNGRWFTTTSAIDRWMTEFAIAHKGKRFCIRNGEIEGA